MSHELTKQSQLLLSFFMKNKCVPQAKHNKKTDTILKKLYHDIVKAHQYIQAKKQKEGSHFYKIKSSRIHSVHQIPRPKTFPATSFPEKARKHIDDHSNYEVSYTFSLFGREIKIHFIMENLNPEIKMDLYNEYIDRMLTWLYIVNEYSAQQCSKNITIFIYLTSLTKSLPTSNVEVLNEIHVNTAFTYTCPVDSEIVIFRKEEWFKVFIHETMHNFALDFSDMNQEPCNKIIRELFPIKSDINLFESYTEFWAEIMNAAFCSVYLQEETDLDSFLEHIHFFIHYERIYGIFQLVKGLHFMELTYKDLYHKHPKSALLRETMYKEKTNIFSYYVVRVILLFFYQGFLEWCDTNNLSLIQFKKTTGNMSSFCEFIKSNYKKKAFLNSIASMEQYFKRGKEVSSKEDVFLFKNMRMSISELG
jgi:hypothetical protein